MGNIFLHFNHNLDESKMKYICPLIVVEDIERSGLFYEKILGQTVKMDLKRKDYRPININNSVQV